MVRLKEGWRWLEKKNGEGGKNSEDNMEEEDGDGDGDSERK